MTQIPFSFNDSLLSEILENGENKYAAGNIVRGCKT